MIVAVGTTFELATTIVLLRGYEEVGSIVFNACFIVGAAMTTRPG